LRLGKRLFLRRSPQNFPDLLSTPIGLDPGRRNREVLNREGTERWGNAATSHRVEQNC
jgi:hypothetical protein